MALRAACSGIANTRIKTKQKTKNTNLVNSLCIDPKHLLIYTDGSQKRNGSNGTGMVAIHANHHHFEAKWNLGRHVEVYDTEAFGILQATSYSRRWATDSNNTSTNTIWIFVDN